MQVIHKHTLKTYEPTLIKLPQMSEILKVDFQRGELQLWVTVDQEVKDTFTAEFVVVPTGVEFDDAELLYFDSAISDDRVWHVFMRIETDADGV